MLLTVDEGERIDAERGEGELLTELRFEAGLLLRPDGVALDKLASGVRWASDAR